MTTINISTIKVVRLSWGTWQDVCQLVPGLVSRENQSKNVDYYHDDCGESATNRPYLQLDIPAVISAVQHDDSYWPQTAYHGDYLALMPNGKVLVIATSEGVEIEPERKVLTIDVEGMSIVEISTLKALFCDHLGKPKECCERVTAEDKFVFKLEDFPLFSTWKHRNGNFYVITDHSNIDDAVSNPAYPPTIHYVNAHNGKKYSGFARDWNRRMTRVAGVI